MKASEKFEIVHFGDYHEIPYYAQKHDCNGEEIGGFFPKGVLPIAGQLRYWGVFWTGTKPKRVNVLKVLKPMIQEVDGFNLKFAVYR